MGVVTPTPLVNHCCGYCCKFEENGHHDYCGWCDTTDCLWVILRSQTHLSFNSIPTSERAMSQGWFSCWTGVFGWNFVGLWDAWDTAGRHFGSYWKARAGWAEAGYARMGAIMYSYKFLSCSQPVTPRTIYHWARTPSLVSCTKTPKPCKPAPLWQTQKYGRYAALVVFYILPLSFVHLVVSVPETAI